MKRIYLDEEGRIVALHQAGAPGLTLAETSLFDDVAAWPDVRLLKYRVSLGAEGEVEMFTPYKTVDELEAEVAAGALHQASLATLGVPPEDVAGVTEDLQQAMYLVNDQLPEALDYIARALYPQWDGDGVPYTGGFKVRRGDQGYKCLQAHTAQADWTPEDTPAIWQPIHEQHSGTAQDPIPAVSGTFFEQGKHYIEPEAPEAVYRYVWPMDMALHWGPGGFQGLVDGGYFVRV